MTEPGDPKAPAEALAAVEAAAAPATPEVPATAAASASEPMNEAAAHASPPSPPPPVEAVPAGPSAAPSAAPSAPVEPPLVEPPPFPEALPPSPPAASPAAPRAEPDEAPPSAGGGKARREERDRPRIPRGPRPDLVSSAEPLYRDLRGYRMRLEPPDLARLRELPGSKGKTDRELGDTFFDGQSERFVASLAEDVPAPADVRVVVDPYSRQAFLAVERKIRSILSF